MRALDEGEEFIVTRNGVPVGRLLPVERQRFVPKEKVLEAFKDAPSIDFEQFRRDLDRWVDPSCEPRG
ncbi:MAG: type II toxin-antitoxin system Phd/YefM family antitoxin [Solirubrobacterales bacterium]